MFGPVIVDNRIVHRERPAGHRVGHRRPRLYAPPLRLPSEPWTSTHRLDMQAAEWGVTRSVGMTAWFSTVAAIGRPRWVSSAAANQPMPFIDDRPRLVCTGARRSTSTSRFGMARSAIRASRASAAAGTGRDETLSVSIRGYGPVRRAGPMLAATRSGRCASGCSPAVSQQDIPVPYGRRRLLKSFVSTCFTTRATSSHSAERSVVVPLSQSSPIKITARKWPVGRESNPRGP